jgi:hypothetical protein
MIKPHERDAIAADIGLDPMDVVAPSSVYDEHSVLLVRRAMGYAYVRSYSDMRAAGFAAEATVDYVSPPTWPWAIYDRDTETIHRLVMSLTARMVVPHKENQNG